EVKKGNLNKPTHVEILKIHENYLLSCASCLVRKELTSKFPTVAELAEEAINLAGTAKHVSVLYVADDELIPSARELVEGIWFGADVKDGCVELFDRTGAGMRFLEVLKEAVASGKVRAVHMESNWRDEVSKG
ncbi:MAG: hypothetical protein HFH49_18240, partial [Lachnospiraceae bacterium]|nr:hypothetical protein [Lachnospiraceae bacterium]